MTTEKTIPAPTAKSLVSNMTQRCEQHALAEDYSTWRRAILDGVSELARICEHSDSVDDRFMDELMECLDSWKRDHRLGFVLGDIYAHLS